jgi:hypothetical protein
VHQEVQGISSSICTIWLATTTSALNAQQPVAYSTSNGAHEEHLRDAAAVFVPVSHKTLLRRVLDGVDVPRISLWSLYQCLPFTLRASMDNPHKIDACLGHVKGTAANNNTRSRVVSLNGTLGGWKEYFRAAVSKRLVFVEDVNLCAALKRGGSPPLARGSASPLQGKRVVRNITMGRRSRGSRRHLPMGGNNPQTSEARHLGVCVVRCFDGS